MDTKINYDQVMSELYMTDTSKVMVELIDDNDAVMDMLEFSGIKFKQKD